MSDSKSMPASPHAAAQLAVIVESSEDAIISKNLDGIILTWNAGAEQIYGYTVAEAIGQPIAILLPKDRRTEEKDILARLSSGERVKPFETTRIRKDGKTIYVSLMISPVRGDDGTILGASHVARDITERRQFEEQLRQAQRLESLGVLAGGIAHDFNNLLTGILGNASIASEILPPGNAAHPMLREIMAASQRLSDLTRQILAYSGKGTFALGPVNISDLVREISALIQASIPKDVHIRLQLDDQLPVVNADASQIQQVIMNLIVNGAEAIPSGEVGTVTVTTSFQMVDEQYIRTVFSPDDLQPGPYVCLEVHDTGQGMNEETVPRIFDPFFTTKVKGRGLGLAAVLGIVRTHKGGIKVYSQPGQGSTFKMLLPASADAAMARPRPLNQELRGTGTILVIDDEELVRRVAKTALELYGYTVVLAENGEQGVALYRQRADEIRAILLDLLMPQMGGEETYRRLRLIRPDVRVILSSGYSDAEAMAKFAGKDLAGFIKKPYTAAQLAQIVQQCLGGGPRRFSSGTV
jgi:PAS domain S-box-containing protein